MGDIICHYVEILIFIGLYRPLVAVSMNGTETELLEDRYNEFPVYRGMFGDRAELTEFPYQIAIKKLIEIDRFITFCGGALIGTRKVLSVAHCFVIDATWCEKTCTGKNRVIRLDNRYAVAGTIKNQETKYRMYRQQWRAIVNAIVPKTYDYPKDDIAVVITMNPFRFDNYVNMIPIARETMDYGQISCNVTGFGKLNVTKYSQYLMWATVKLLASLECTSLNQRDMDKFICTSAFTQENIEGDSGAPLVCFETGDPNDVYAGVLVGVVTSTFWPAATFTRVSAFYNFIETSNNASISTINFICLYILISYHVKFIL